MPSTLRPGGFIVSPRSTNNGYVNGGMSTYPIANSYSPSIFVGDLVKLGTDGTIQKVTVSTDYPLGVFAGLKPEGQGRNPSKYWVAGTSASVGQIQALVVLEGNTVYEVQADGSVSAGDIGTNFDVTVGTGNGATTGMSTSRVHASSRSDAAGFVKMVGISTRADNSITDAFPYILVKLNNGQFTAKTSVV